MHSQFKINESPYKQCGVTPHFLSVQKTIEKIKLTID